MISVSAAWQKQDSISWERMESRYGKYGCGKEMLRLMPGLYENPKVQEIIRELIHMFPEKEVIDY